MAQFAVDSYFTDCFKAKEELVRNVCNSICSKALAGNVMTDSLIEACVKSCVSYNNGVHYYKGEPLMSDEERAELLKAGKYYWRKYGEILDAEFLRTVLQEAQDSVDEELELEPVNSSWDKERQTHVCNENCKRVKDFLENYYRDYYFTYTLNQRAGELTLVLVRRKEVK